MKVTTKIVFDCEGNVLEHEWFEYSGPVAECKGQDVAQGQQQQELAMQQQAFQTQMQQLQTLNGAFSKYLSGNIGYSPTAMAGMTSQFLNSNNNTFNQAGQQVRSALGARGEGTGALPTGGNYAQGIASLMGGKAQSQSQGLLGLQVQNQQQALQNQFNAGSLLSGNAATLTGTQGVAGNAASSALQSYIQGINAPGFLQSLGTSFASGLGGALGAGVSGGLGTAASTVGSGNFGW